MLRLFLVTALSFALALAARSKDLPQKKVPPMKTPVRVRDLNPEDDRFMSELRVAGSGWVEIEDGVLMQVRSYFFGGCACSVTPLV